MRAIYEWCCDNNTTPHITVAVDASVRVPMEHVRDGEIVLNIGLAATTGLELGNDYISFRARFGGVAREVMIPVDHVLAIFSRENGQGMAFPGVSGSDVTPPQPPPPPTKRPTLTRVK
ncbi:MAG: ClpXP protease specificity-enhancing factor [Rhodoferax sp.]|nr:ClpXP protease specificity-enhancing factor [Rhodoferax sp.]